LPVVLSHDNSICEFNARTLVAASNSKVVPASADSSCNVTVEVALVPLINTRWPSATPTDIVGVAVNVTAPGLPTTRNFSASAEIAVAAVRVCKVDGVCTHLPPAVRVPLEVNAVTAAVPGVAAPSVPFSVPPVIATAEAA